MTEISVEVPCAASQEALAHSPSQMPLTCPVAPPSQRELHKDRGGGGGGVARRASAARAPKAKFCATSCGTSSATPSAACSAAFCAASFTCPMHAHARPLHPVALAFVPYGVVLVRVRVRSSFTCSSFTCFFTYHLRASVGAARFCWAWIRKPPWPRTGPRPGSGSRPGRRAPQHSACLPLEGCV